MSHLLYFPYINLPKSEWTFRTLLYYDSISSIVPDEYFYEPQYHYEPFMLELVREQLVTPLNPIQVLENPYSLVEPFIAFIKGRYYQIEKKRELFRNQEDKTRISNKKFSPSNINALKFNDQLLYNLAQLGLAKHIEGAWYEVENYTAGYLMSYLSNIIASKLELLPVTDRPLNLPFYMSYNKPLSTNEAKIRRDKILNGIIPYPLELNLSKMMRLKERYSGELIALRSIVEQIALDSKYDSEELLNEKIRELNYNKDQLLARFKESQIGNILFGNVCGLVGAAYGFTQTNSTVGAVIGGSIGFANALHSALKIEDQTKIYDPSGMKYLAIMDNKLRTKLNPN